MKIAASISQVHPFRFCRESNAISSIMFIRLTPREILPVIPFSPTSVSITLHGSFSNSRTLLLSRKLPCRPIISLSFPSESRQNQLQKEKTTRTQDDGIPIDEVKVLVKFKSRHNYIRVLEVSRDSDHPFRGSRLLLLDGPGNIHSINFLYRTLTDTYFDVFATLPPIIPPGPIGILGFGAGSAAKLILKLYPEVVIHGWELDPSVIDVGREYFGLSKLEKQHPDRLFIYIGNALKASVKNGFSGILVDLFSKGSLIPELQDPLLWEKLKKSLRNGGRVMVNVGGSCVEAEDSRRDGSLVMMETLKAMYQVFNDCGVSVLSLGNRDEDSSLALTGSLPKDLNAWKMEIPKALRCYVDMWKDFEG